MKRYERLMKRLESISHDQFVMHGTTKRLRHGALIPRKQWIKFPNKPELCRKRVYATTVIDIAVIYAVVDIPSALWDWRLMRVNGEYGLYCRMKQEASLCSGFIHVLPRRQFKTLQKRFIYSSRQRVRPVQTIRIPDGVLPWLLTKNKFVKFVWEYPPDDRDPRA